MGTVLMGILAQHIGGEGLLAGFWTFDLEKSNVGFFKVKRWIH
jgi:hypothetical protein